MVRLVLFLLAFILVSVDSTARGTHGGFGGSVSVRGYFKSNGTYVAPHYRSAPDGNFYNNWSTKGNFNPYTREPGTKVTPPAGYGGYGGYTAPIPGSAVSPSRDDIPAPATVQTPKMQYPDPNADDVAGSEDHEGVIEHPAKYSNDFPINSVQPPTHALQLPLPIKSLQGVAATFDVVPGVRAGPISIGSLRQKVGSELGQPNSSFRDVANFTDLAVHYSGDRVSEIIVMSPQYKTANGLSPASTPNQFLAVYPEAQMDCYKDSGAILATTTFVYDAIDKGIALEREIVEGRDRQIVTSLTIHRRGVPSPLYGELSICE